MLALASETGGPETHQNASPGSSALSKRTRSQNDGRPSGADPDNKLFRCGDCGKSYSRVDHLTRHIRLHTQEKPYVCETCGKGFARVDLVKRHASVHSNETGKRFKPYTRASNQQGRVSKACTACASLHLKCDDTKPCLRCRTKEITCQENTVLQDHDSEDIARRLLDLSQHDVRYSNSSPSAANGQGDFSQDQNTSILSHEEVTLQDPDPGQSQEDMEYSSTMQHHHSMDNIEPQHNFQALDNMHPGNDYDPALDVEPDGNILRDFLLGITSDNARAHHNGINQTGTWTPRSLFDFGFDTNIDFTEMDQCFLADYNLNNPFATSPATNSSLSRDSQANTTITDPPMGVETLQKSSVWRFRPQSKDNRDNNLSLPSNETTRRPNIERRIISEQLLYTARDDMLSIMMNSKLHTRVFPSFPSVELLDSLVQYFFATAPTASLIHLPTFSPNKQRPELTICLVAAGAVLAPDSALKKLGFALQEAARNSLAHSVESDNTLIRNLQVLQSAYLETRIAIWSGIDRKMEIAESFEQPWTTMIRRGGWFGRRYEDIVLSPEDSGAILEQKWLQWITAESKKRLVFAWFLHDTQASISLFINPLISYAELLLPLPYHRSLWLADSAQAWKDIYLSQPDFSKRPPSVIDVLQNMDKCYDRNTFNEQVATYALLSATWGFIREYRQQISITHNVPSQWNSGGLLLSNRFQELKRLLECLRMAIPDDSKAKLFLEVQSIHLHMSLEDVHVFAGVEGPTEARRVYPILKDWARTNTARQAMQHAGQIVRYAREIPYIHEFEAVAVYQAALAFWSYGVISNAAHVSNGTTSDGAASSTFSTALPSQQDVVFLDGVDTSATQRYIAVDRGCPSLSSSKGEAILLSDPGSVMTVLMDMLKESHRSVQQRPFLVDNLLELMAGLRAAVVTGDEARAGC